MIPVPTYLTLNTFGGSATLVAPGAGTYSSGYLPGQEFPAENQNWLLNRMTSNGNVDITSITALCQEMVNYLASQSVVINPTDFTQIGTTITAQINTVSSGYVTTHANITTAPIHGSSVTTTNNSLAHRDSTGRLQSTTPGVFDADNYVATMGNVKNLYYTNQTRFSFDWSNGTSSGILYTRATSTFTFQIGGNPNANLTCGGNFLTKNLTFTQCRISGTGTLISVTTSHIIPSGSYYVLMNSTGSTDSFYLQIYNGSTWINIAFLAYNLSIGARQSMVFSDGANVRALWNTGTPDMLLVRVAT